MFGKAFKPRAHYVFNYKPRYYDERKERLEKLKEQYKKDKSATPDLDKITFSKDHLKSNWKRHKKVSSNRAVNKRLAVIITILVGILAYLFEVHTLF
ncbi:hypothetical protein [Lutimonas sp.]|uniref:hypothetical protein n=1 Tax=Lutimonas sp. TaxID=1872403 RepID=UPI003D9B2530